MTVAPANNEADDVLARYVGAASQLTGMPLTAERLSAVATALARIARLAAHVESFELSNDVEIAGVFTP